MKVLITGATGLIGSQIIEDCIKSNIKVNFLTTSRSKITKSDLVSNEEMEIVIDSIQNIGIRTIKTPSRGSHFGQLGHRSWLWYTFGYTFEYQPRRSWPKDTFRL